MPGPYPLDRGGKLFGAPAGIPYFDCHYSHLWSTARRAIHPNNPGGNNARIVFGRYCEDRQLSLRPGCERAEQVPRTILRH